ncbi:hypothetical protein SI65_08467 [Aspergillus cristatus]|uniref:Alpha/beta hydrolase fold-3 domain-containing protein n=1 Tax=Aspergillus cristatus TaxID=573508 RepID=A0A1E3B503_ASPCR|nr:hypothetical protein SI65_08467 [Aspergillus cristatus]
MALKYDPEFAQAAAPILPARAAASPAAVHDVEIRRTRITAAYAAAFKKLPETPDVEHKIYQIKSHDGQPISVYHFYKKSGHATPGSAVFHTHGGGTIQGDVELFVPLLANEVQQTGVQFFSVDYRLAPEHPHPIPEEDCYAALTWVYEHADEFGIDRSRIATMGESAGGRLALVMSLMARDRKLSPPLAKQILIYPMLDDRNTNPIAALEPFAMWSNDDNITAWTALLGKDVVGTDKVPEYAAPARVQNLEGLPPTFIDVGELDVFRDEDYAFAGRLAAANISTEFHVYPGLPHAFEVYAPEIDATRRAVEHRMKAVTSV